MDKLLPCPFCGGEPEQEATGSLEIRGFCYHSTWIECTKCGAEGQVFDSSDDGAKDSPEASTKKAVTAWNTRHTPEGWRLVPVEFTAAMDDACEIEWHEADEWRDLYQAMLAAAPKWGGE